LAALVGVGIGSVVVGQVASALSWLGSDRARPLWLSVQIALTATLVAGAAGIAGGYWLAKARFAGRDLLEALGSVPIILPPTVLGYYLLLGLGDSATGRALTRLVGRPLLFNPTACVIAASVAAFPFCLRATRAAVEGVDPQIEQGARALGLPEWRVALHVTMPRATRGIAAGLTLGCMRALGEFGATLMVGGDIPGRTRTMSLAVTDARTTGETRTLVLLLLLLAAAALAGILRLGRTPA